MIGQTISHYKILEKLGEGGMGVVYKAQDTRLDRFVALKFLPPKLVSSPDDVARFEMEAKAISALNHPHIATIYDVDEADVSADGQAGGKKFLVLEYIQGGTLKAKLKQLLSGGKHLTIEEIVAYGIQIAEGLACAHHANIVHRDVKSDNVMLIREGYVKLTDFGLAKLQNAAQLTKAGSTIGTAAYMSPEQMRGEEVDGRSDLFSLGVVLYEMTTNHMPFRGEHETALAYSIVNENPQPISQFRQNVPDTLAAIIACCLEKDPANRYQTAEDVVRDLRMLNRESSRTVSVITGTQKSVLPWIGGGAAVIVIAVALYLFMPTSKGGKEITAAEVNTIAILPFDDLSPKKDQGYFSDGLSEELITTRFFVT